MAIFVTCVVAAVLAFKFLLFLFRHFTHGKTSVNPYGTWQESGSFTASPETSTSSIEQMDSLNPLSTTHPFSPLNPVNMVDLTDSSNPLEPTNIGNPLSPMNPLNPLNPVGYSASMGQCSDDHTMFEPYNMANDENNSIRNFD